MTPRDSHQTHQSWIESTSFVAILYTVTFVDKVTNRVRHGKRPRNIRENIVGCHEVVVGSGASVAAIITGGSTSGASLVFKFGIMCHGGRSIANVLSAEIT
jgi:hypothetical protein